MKKLLFIILVGMAFAGTTMAAGDVDSEKETRAHMFYVGMFIGCFNATANAKPIMTVPIVIRSCKQAVVDREIIDGQTLAFRRENELVLNASIEQMISGWVNSTK